MNFLLSSLLSLTSVTFVSSYQMHPPWYVRMNVEPAGEKSMGDYTVVQFSKEQQQRYHCDADGVRTSFPDLFKMSCDLAITLLQSERPDVRIEVIPWDHMVTMDYNEKRVRIFCDDEGNVASIPRIG